jgi:hypothetical protein
MPIEQMNLTPEEMNIYRHHLENLTPNRWNKLDDGSTMTVYSRTELGDEYGGKPGRWYVFPSYWSEHKNDVNKGVLDGDKLWDAIQPMSQWPDYASQKEADDRYRELHGAMEMDMEGYP